MSETSNYRRNFAFNVADGAAWQLGMAFTSVAAILPVYVSRLTTSTVLVGLIPAIVDMGWFLPQLFTAPLITRLKRAKPYVVTITTFERLPFLALALVALFAPHEPPATVLAIFFFRSTSPCVFSPASARSSCRGCAWLRPSSRPWSRPSRGRAGASIGDRSQPSCARIATSGGTSWRE